MADAELQALREQLRLMQVKLAALEDENALLAEGNEDAVLLGLVAEQLQGASGPEQILRAGLERISVLKDLPLVACLELGEGEARVVDSYASFTDQAPVAGPVPFAPALAARLAEDGCLLQGAACAETGLGSGRPVPFQPAAVLLVPFRSRALADGVFAFADDRGPAALTRSVAVLHRFCETLVARLDADALVAELRVLNDQLEQKVRERTRDLQERAAALAAENAQRLRVEQELRRSEELLRLSLEAARAGAFEWEPAGSASWSVEVERLLGLGPGALAPTLSAYLDAVHPEDRETVARALRSVAEGPEEGRVGVEHRVAGGPGRLELHARRVGGRVVGVAWDVTERARLEQELRQSQKLESVGQLAGGIAHDFNNHLTTILGVTELALLDLPAGALRDDLEAVRESAAHAAALTRQLLAFSRRQVLQMAPVDLGELCRGFSRMLGRVLGEQVELGLALDPATPPVLADQAQLQQVLLNLAVNARDAMPRGGALVLRTRQEEGLAVLEVEDAGAGIPPEVLPRIFEPFFTTKEPGRGTGLGLATVYGIVRQHGGRVEVRSQVGKGSVFTCLLPPLGPGKAAPPRTGLAPEVGRGRGESVLVVDDDPSVRAVVRASLERLGYAPTVAAPGPSLERLLAEGRFEVLVCDVVMPGRDGQEVARAFRAGRPGGVVVLMSGYTAEGLDPAGHDVFLQKPLTPAAIGAAVREALSRRGG